MAGYGGIVRNPFRALLGDDPRAAIDNLFQTHSASKCDDHAPESDDRFCENHHSVANLRSETENLVKNIEAKCAKIDTEFQHLTLVCKEATKAGELWFDTGCRRCVSGPRDHENFTIALLAIGLRPVQIMKREQFIFGVMAKPRLQIVLSSIPLFREENLQLPWIYMARVPVDCPGLFSLGMAQKWKCVTDHAEQTLTTKKCNRTYPFKKGTPYIDVLDFTLESLDLSKVPDCFKVPDH